MCGIWVLCHRQTASPLNEGGKVLCHRHNHRNEQTQQNTSTPYANFQQLANRGPDYSSFQVYPGATVGFHRLSIVNSSFYGNQPFVMEDGDSTFVFVCNGEIYNWLALSDKYGLSCNNDCMVIPLLYIQQQGRFEEVIGELKGEFAFVLLEFVNPTLPNGNKKGAFLKTVIAARDQIGVRPLYYSEKEGFFTSEIKGTPDGIQVIEFPPGIMMTFDGNGDTTRYDFSTVYDVIPKEKMEDQLLTNVYHSVLNSVSRRLNAAKPFAYLLSGGIDSSLVAAIGAERSHVPIRTFCCSIKEGTYQIGESLPFTTGPGTDLLFAREVAKHIRSDHTEVFFTPQEGLDAIPDVIRTIESWDTTTVRASVGQYMVCKWIGQNTDCKVVMVGEGPDEVCSSYLFNWYAPNGEALATSAKDYVRKIHYYDVKRADRCISRWGLEGRVPLLDPEFIEAYWAISGEERMPKTRGIEKWWLREAFSPERLSRGEPFAYLGLLPESVRLRKKEAFSDGVSNTKSWYQMIQDFVETKVTVEELQNAALLFPYYTPTTKEAYYYRSIFESLFPGREQIIPGFWQPKWSADGEVKEYIDPSARVLGVY
jgi:asparagine synthase (glutamine-hydrolysing)